MGKEPMNPIGECFDSSAAQFLLGENPDRCRLCHGIGVANMPGQEGREIGHAWLQFTLDDGREGVIDTTWGVVVEANHYRKNLKLKYVVEYNMEEARANWEKYDMPGPWDKKILKVIEGR